DGLVVEERPVGAAEVADEELAPLGEQGTVALADDRAGGPQLALRGAAGDKLRHGDRDHPALCLPLGNHHPAQFHCVTSLPLKGQRSGCRQFLADGPAVLSTPCFSAVRGNATRGSAVKDLPASPRFFIPPRVAAKSLARRFAVVLRFLGLLHD